MCAFECDDSDVFFYNLIYPHRSCVSKHQTARKVMNIMGVYQIVYRSKKPVRADVEQGMRAKNILRKKRDTVYQPKIGKVRSDKIEM